MEVINIKNTARTPLLIADPDKGIIEIRGRSNPENTLQFYTPLINWLNEFAENNLNTLELIVDLEYFNTSTSKSLMDLLRKIRKMGDKGKRVKVSWYYEEDDEDMLETAEIYKSLSKIPFDILTKPSSDPLE